MLDTLFATVLDMSIKGALVTLVVLLVRLMLRRAPKVISYGLWLVVLLRLLCPLSIQLPVSVLPEVTPVAPNYALEGGHGAQQKINEIHMVAQQQIGRLHILHIDLFYFILLANEAEFAQYPNESYNKKWLADRIFRGVIAPFVFIIDINIHNFTPQKRFYPIKKEKARILFSGISCKKK